MATARTREDYARAAPLARQRVLEHYSGRPPACAWCGAQEDLELDHIQGAGGLDEPRAW
jgi:hypothetical protein